MKVQVRTNDLNHRRRHILEYNRTNVIYCRWIFDPREKLNEDIK